MRLTRRRSTGAGPGAPPVAHPAAGYAGLLDGRRLWLSVDVPADSAGELALRDAARTLPLAGDPAAGLDLPDEAGEWDVVCDGQPVTVDPLPTGPTRVPPSPDGRWQRALLRTDAGTLRLRSTPRDPGIDVLDLTVDGDGDGDGVRVTLAADATEVRVGDATFAVVDRVVVLTAGPSGPVLAQPGDLPLRRRANGLAAPGQAVLLPEPLRWSPAGELVAK